MESVTDHAGRERFTPAVKACRDRLVDDVERLLGVPIIGTSTPVERISAADVVAARQCLDWAISALAEEPEPVGPQVLACRSELHAVAGLLDAVAATPADRRRRLRLARRRLQAAVDQLTVLLFAEPDPADVSGE